MGERREWALIGLVVTCALVAMMLFLPSEHAGSPYSTLSTNLASPSGAEALYLTMKRMGIGVARREAPLADMGALPRALAVLAPDQPLTPREVGNVLAMVRRGGTLLWVHAVGSLGGDRLADSLGLSVVFVPGGGRLQARAHPWMEGVEGTATFQFAFRNLDTLGAGAKPLLVDQDTLVVAFVAPFGSGRIVGLSDPDPLENANIAKSGLAPFLVRAGAAAAAAGGGTLVFDEFHHGFEGGSVRAGVTTFLLHYRLGHVVAQLLLVGFLGLLFASARLGAPAETHGTVRRSPLEHVEALGQVYREASAVRVPNLLLLGGLARALGEPAPRGGAEAADLLRRVERRGGSSAQVARELRERLERGEADVLAVATDIDRIRKELGR